MITIWKYEIPIEDNFTLELPVNSKILSFQLQKEVPTIWVQVDTKVKTRKRHFRLCRTGHELDNLNHDLVSEHWKFIGTVQLLKGNIIFHLFRKEVI